MKNFAGVVVIAALLSACSSPVKLDTPPVEDKGPAPVAPAAAAPPPAQATVTTVNTDKAKPIAAMPAGARVVYFDFDSFVIRPEFQSVIEGHAKYIAADKARKVAIEGHTDERGGREYNLALGQKRAEAVRRALGLLGVADNQVEAVSFGKEKPAVTGNTEAAFEKNRRAEISYR